MTIKTLNVRQMLRDLYGAEVIDRDSDNPNIVTVRDIAATQEAAKPVSSVGKAVGGIVGAAVPGPIGSAIGQFLGSEVGAEAGQAVGEKIRAVERKIDLNKMMEDVAKEYQLDPTQTKLKLSSENEPLETPALNFVDRVSYSMTRTDNDKQKFLTENYGAENVRKAKDGTFAIKKGEDWYKADSTIMSDLVSESPAIAGGAAGASFGAGLGSTVAPGVGTVVGGALGAGVGAALGKLSSLKAAEMSGLRTEDDAAQVAREVGKEFIFGLAGEAVVPVLKLSGKAMSNSLGRAYGKIAKEATSDSAKYATATALSKMTGVDIVDNLVYLDAPDVVTKHQSRVVDWLEAGQARGEANPVEIEMAEIAQNVIKRGKEFTQSSFETQAKKVGEMTQNLKIDTTAVIKNIANNFNQAGMVDSSGNWLKANEREIAKIVDPKSVNKLRQAWTLVSNAAKKNGELSFDEVHTLIGNFDEMLEAAGAYSRGQGEIGITSPAIAQLKDMRSQLKSAVVDSLQKTNPQAHDAYLAMNKEYSQARGFLDELMPMSADERVQTLISRIADGKAASGPAKEAFRGIIKKMGQNPDIVMKELLTRKAAISTAELTRKGSGGMGAIGAAVTGTTNPRVTTKFTADKFARLKAQGAASELIRGLTPAQRQQLIQKPEYMRTIEQSIVQALQGAEQTKQELLAPLQGGNGQGQGNGGM